MTEKYPDGRKANYDMTRRNLMVATGVMMATASMAPGMVAAQTTSQPIITRRRMLGSLSVSEMGLGCMSMNSGNYNPPRTAAEMRPVIEAAIDGGVDFFDTAEAYGPFVNESLVGALLQPHRERVIIATKFGWEIDPATGRRTGGLNSKPQHIRDVVEASLTRLRTDRIDLLYQHRVDPAVPIEDVAGTIKDLIGEGKLRHYGLSEPGMQTLRRAHAVHPVSAIQQEYSLLWRGPEKEELAIAEELGIGLVSWSPLGVGFLGGSINESTRFENPNYTDYRLANPRFTPEALKANMPLITLLRQWSERKNATPAQLSLAWLMAQRPWIVAIPGTTSIAHLRENLAAVNVRFTPEELQEFDTATAAIEIHGVRLSPRLLPLSGVEAAPKA